MYMYIYILGIQNRLCSFEPLETFHRVKAPSFPFTAMDISGSLVRSGAADDSTNSELGRKRLLGAVSDWDYPILAGVGKCPFLGISVAD